MKILTAFGTRPEAIKLAPVLLQLERRSPVVDSVVCVTGQHRQMLDQILSLFGVKAQYDLDIMLEGQDLFDISINTLSGLRKILVSEKPDLVLVQGDTTSALFAALAAYYCQIPVAHVEAGLRTFDKDNPFPEEVNRTLISMVAEFHFAPTPHARDNLLAAGVPPLKIHVTGNTVVDTIHMILQRPPPPLPLPLASMDFRRTQLILMTAHRRESFGPPMRRILSAMRDVLERSPDAMLVFPMHMNPNVRAAVAETLSTHERVILLEPLSYDAFVHLMKSSYLIVTDSGGVQEEAAALGTPVVVVRETTERMESVEAGMSVVVGREPEVVRATVERLLNDENAYRAMMPANCPYGNGTAARQVADILTRSGLGGRVQACAGSALSSQRLYS